MSISKLNNRQSRPARARGLKLVVLIIVQTFFPVAPRTGAWIETHNTNIPQHNYTVSRPARARGLKLIIQIYHNIITLVAPRTGAWIETPPLASVCGRTWSRPARARGLKPIIIIMSTDISQSRPARARGLKLWLCSRREQMIYSRAPHGRVD